jgi:hypothetical protein
VADDEPEPEPELDPAAPLFFLSYGRMKPLKRPTPLPATDPNAKVQHLFNELSTQVNNLVYRETGADPGYMDLAMRGSESWHQELSSAVGNCQVFVALLSPPLLSSHWCAREWAAFASRTVRRRPNAVHHFETSILPVIWTSPDNYRIPDKIGAVQLFNPDRLPKPYLGQQYQEDGLWGMLTAGVEGTDAIILRLAQHIVRLSRTNYVEPGLAIDIASLPRTFK